MMCFRTVGYIARALAAVALLGGLQPASANQQEVDGNVAGSMGGSIFGKGAEMVVAIGVDGLTGRPFDALPDEHHQARMGRAAGRALDARSDGETSDRRAAGSDAQATVQAFETMQAQREFKTERWAELQAPAALPPSPRRVVVPQADIASGPTRIAYPCAEPLSCRAVETLEAMLVSARARSLPQTALDRFARAWSPVLARCKGARSEPVCVVEVVTKAALDFAVGIDRGIAQTELDSFGRWLDAAQRSASATQVPPQSPDATAYRRETQGLQEALIALGFTVGRADGVMGRRTRDAAAAAIAKHQIGGSFALDTSAGVRDLADVLNSIEIDELED